MESKSTQTAVSQYLNQYRDPKKVFVHVSSPCASGSPLRHFKGNNEPTSADFDWDQIFPLVGFYLKLGDCSSFELPWRNEIWNRFLTTETLRKAGHLFDVQVHLCATGFRTASGRAVGKSLGFTSNSRPFVMIMNQNFGQCKCVDQHAAMNEVNWSWNGEIQHNFGQGHFESCHESTGSDMIVLLWLVMVWTISLTCFELHFAVKRVCRLIRWMVRAHPVKQFQQVLMQLQLLVQHWWLVQLRALTCLLQAHIQQTHLGCPILRPLQIYHFQMKLGHLKQCWRGCTTGAWDVLMLVVRKIAEFFTSNVLESYMKLCKHAGVATQRRATQRRSWRAVCGICQRMRTLRCIRCLWFRFPMRWMLQKELSTLGQGLQRQCMQVRAATTHLKADMSMQLQTNSWTCWRMIQMKIQRKKTNQTVMRWWKLIANADFVISTVKCVNAATLKNGWYITMGNLRAVQVEMGTTICNLG